MGGFASSSRVSDSLASETHPAYRGQRMPRSDINSSYQEQVDVYSVTSGGGMMYRGGPGVIETSGHASNGTGRLYLTAAQVALQQQQQNIIDHDHINAAQQQHLQQQQQQQQQYLTSPSQPHILHSPLMVRSQPQQMNNLVLQQQQQQQQHHQQQQHMNGLNVGFEDVLQHGFLPAPN